MGDTRAGRVRLAAVAGLSTLAVLCAGLAALVLIRSVLPQSTGGDPDLASQARVLALIEEVATPGALLAAALVATATWQLGGSSRGRGAVTAAAATALLVTFADARWLPAVALSDTDLSNRHVPWPALGAAATASGLLVAAIT
ncbi:hypothetical protein, partial [Streptomyces sp. H39-S7]|uniref:hypothetical protein n=1 Tax=Streptomyces sp. H39-S7 TaxID=3004357 RepID=UPI0022AF6DA3